MNDPLTAMPPTARRVLEGARRVVMQRGMGDLTLKNISLASGENPAAVAYYFGNKKGLIEALVDSMVHDECVALSRQMARVPEEDRVDRLVEGMRMLFLAGEPFRVFFDVLPHALRDPELRGRLVSLYRWYLTIQVDWLGLRGDLLAGDRERARGLASLVSAVIDGLAIQAAIDPDGSPVDEAYSMFNRLLKYELGPSPEDTGPSSSEEAPESGALFSR